MKSLTSPWGVVRADSVVEILENRLLLSGGHERAAAPMLANTTTYVYADLNDPNASFGTMVQGISGTAIVGWNDNNTHPRDGFIYNEITGVWKKLNDPNSVNGTFAQGVFRGKVVGYYEDQNGINHGFIYYRRTYTTFYDPNASKKGSADGTNVTGISGSAIVGYYIDSRGTTDSFIYNENTGTYTKLVDPDTQGDTQVNGISGTIVVGTYAWGGVYESGFIGAPAGSASISGTVFDDHNGNGIQEPNDDPLAGIIMILRKFRQGRIFGHALITTTDSRGDYSFTGLVNRSNSTYRITESLPRHSTLTTPNAASYTITLLPGQDSTDNNFGDHWKDLQSAAAVTHASTPFATHSMAMSAASADAFLFSTNPRHRGLFAG